MGIQGIFWFLKMDRENFQKSEHGQGKLSEIWACSVVFQTLLAQSAVHPPCWKQIMFYNCQWRVVLSWISNYLGKIKVFWTGLGKFKHFFDNLGKYKANFTQGQIWWTRIGQGNFNLSLTFYSQVKPGRYVE